MLVVKRPVRGPYRRVLVATDFSDQSGQALEFSLRLAPGAKVHILHAYQGIVLAQARMVDAATCIEVCKLCGKICGPCGILDSSSSAYSCPFPFPII